MLLIRTSEASANFPGFFYYLPFSLQCPRGSFFFNAFPFLPFPAHSHITVHCNQYDTSSRAAQLGGKYDLLLLLFFIILFFTLFLLPHTHTHTLSLLFSLFPSFFLFLFLYLLTLSFSLPFYPSFFFLFSSSFCLLFSLILCFFVASLHYKLLFYTSSLHFLPLSISIGFKLYSFMCCFQP